MFYLLILTDFILFLYIYIGTQWVGWSLEETLASKAGTALMLLSVFIILKKGFSIKPWRLGRSIIISGLAILLSGLILSLNMRSADTLVIAEGEKAGFAGRSVKLNNVITEDSPGLIRNDVFANISLEDNSKNNRMKSSSYATIQIMPGKLRDGAYWRITRFGYAPVLSWYSGENVVGENTLLMLASENWTGKDEIALMDYGLIRNPPPRMMLGVGAFPPEMEALISPDEIEQAAATDDNLQDSMRTEPKMKAGRKIFMRLSKTYVNGRPVSLDGDDYWRYLVNGRLQRPTLSVSALANGELAKNADITTGEEFQWDDTKLRFEKLNYWVELERRVDPMVPAIIFGLITVYFGVAVSIVQFIAKVKRNVFPNNR